MARDKSGKIRVLFIDEMNALQSQIAEYFLNSMYPDRYEAYSAGARFDCIDCELISSMYQIGHDIRQYRAKDFRAKQIPTKQDYLIFLEKATYDRIKDVVPYDSPIIVKDFGSREDIKASDDRELFDSYKSYIEKIREWVESTFSDPENLKGLVG